MKRRQCAVTDSEWDELKRRAQDAGMDVSRFVFERLMTEPSAPEPPAALERAGGGGSLRSGEGAHVRRGLAGPAAQGGRSARRRRLRMSRKADLARQRSVYCSAVEWAAIAERAAAADMNVSRLACALGEDGPPDGQEELLRKVELFDRFVDALLVRLPGTEMSMLGALAFLVRERGG